MTPASGALLESASPPINPLHRLRDGNVGGGRGGEDRFQRGVVARAQEGKGRGQRAGADAGDDFEFGPLAARGPAVQHASAKSAVGAAAGDRQKIDDRSRALGEQLRPCGANLRPFLLDHGVGVGRERDRPNSGLVPNPCRRRSPGSPRQGERDCAARQRKRRGRTPSPRPILGPSPNPYAQRQPSPVGPSLAT